MNWVIMEERIKKLPDDFQEQAFSFIDILFHNYETEQPNNPESELIQKDINQKRMEVIRTLIQESDMDLLLNVQNFISDYKNKLTKWEEEQLEIGLQDLDNGKRIPHKTVMKRIDIRGL